MFILFLSSHCNYFSNMLFNFHATKLEYYTTVQVGMSKNPTSSVEDSIPSENKFATKKITSSARRNSELK